MLRRHELRDHLRFEDRPGLGLAEELGHADQEVLGQGLELGRGVPEIPAVVADRGDTIETHAPLNTAQQHGLLVTAKVMPFPSAQQGQYGVQTVVPRVGGDRDRTAAEMGMLDILEQRRGHLFHGQHVVHEPRGDGAAGHPVVLCGIGALDHHQAALRLDRLEPERPVAAGARHDDADGPLLLVLRQAP